MVDPLTFFWLCLKATLLSSGGLGNVPSLHEDLIGRGWATDGQFGAALAVGQIAPGPTGLWVVSLGYLVLGGLGAALAAVAAVLPPLLILFVEALHRRFGELPHVKEFVRGLSLAVIAIFPIILARLVISQGLDAQAGLIAAGAFGLGVTRRVPPALIVGLAAIAGVLAYR
ncbi:MAG: chromate transporter [Candidatus Dormibacterales bacterium]